MTRKEVDGRNGKNKKEKQVEEKKKGEVGCKGDTERNGANGLCGQRFLGQSKSLS